MKKTILLIITSISFFSLTIFSQDKTEYEEQIRLEFDSIFSKHFNSNEPGATILITHKDRIIYNNTFGMANMELNVPMKEDMVFEIASISKSFTAIAILQLMEAGKIALSDSINKYIPDYPVHGHYISIEHLLTHTSGINNWNKTESFNQSLQRNDYTTLEFISQFKNLEMLFAPEEKWGYSNSGYMLLGYIIEKISGMSYKDYISEYIFKPAGMENSYYNDYEQIIKNRVEGYEIRDERYINAEYVSPTVLHAAGALMSTTSDLFKFNKSLNDYKLISKESLEKSRTSYKLNNGEDAYYGYGVEVRNVWGYPAVYHVGGGSGFFTMNMYFPDRDYQFILLTNCEANFDNFVYYFEIMTLPFRKEYVNVTKD